MYRRLESSLPPDFTFANDLKGMGYFVNDNDQIRMIDDPEQPFHYHASKNERYVEMQKAAYDACQSEIILKRLHDTGLRTTRLPAGASASARHVPILTSVNLQSCERVIVFIGESMKELGVLAGRLMNSDGNNIGSLVNFAHDVLGPSSAQSATITTTTNTTTNTTTPTTVSPPFQSPDPVDQTPVDSHQIGLVIANPGQLLYHNRSQRALSFQSWYTLPRKYAVSDQTTITSRNYIPRNKNKAEHIACVFEDVVYPLIMHGVKVDVIAINDAIDDVVELLDRGWEDKWKRGVEAVVVASGFVYSPSIVGEGFAEFWGKRARAYIVSDAPPGTSLTGRQQFGCNVYSGGTPDFVECVMPRAYKDFIDYFEHVSQITNFQNDVQEITEEAEALDADDTWAGQEEKDVMVPEPA